MIEICFNSCSEEKIFPMIKWCKEHISDRSKWYAEQLQDTLNFYFDETLLDEALLFKLTYSGLL